MIRCENIIEFESRRQWLAMPATAHARAGRANEPSRLNVGILSRSTSATVPPVSRFKVAANADVGVAPPRNGNQKSSNELNSIVSSRLVVLTFQRPQLIQSSPRSLSLTRLGAPWPRGQATASGATASAACQNNDIIGRPS